MKEKTNDGTHTRPLLDKLDADHTSYIQGDLAQTIAQQPLENFEGGQTEFIFQLMEAELRATDAGHIQSVLSSIKELAAEPWSLILKHAIAIENGQADSAISHQLIALIQLTDEH